MHLDLQHRLDRRPSRTSLRHFGFQAEVLESRALLSTVDLSGLTAAPALSAAARTSGISGLTPAQIASAYNFPSTTGTPLGTGQTIAIVDAYNDPNIATDLASFSKQFGLPAANLQVVNQNGGSALPAADAGWAQEISLDVELAHAAAPGAKILLVEASSSSLSDLVQAVQTASHSASVVSMSWGGSEFWGENSLDSLFNVPGVTFVASAGDTPGTSWPAVSPNVVGVGGTTLTLSSSGGYGSESVWRSTGGGISFLEPAPSYQAAYSGLLGVGARVSPDVGFDANPSSGFAVLDTYQNNYSSSGWFQVGGTSAGAPEWAGIFADANALRSSPLSSSSALSTLYSVANNATTAASDFHKVTAGGSYFLNLSTGTTFSLGTGLGTPNVANVIAALSGTSHASTTTTTTTTSGSTGTGSTATGTTGTGTTGTGSTGSGATGGQTGGGQTSGKHHRFSDPNTQVTVSLTPTPATPTANMLATVANATTAPTTSATAATQTISVAPPTSTTTSLSPVAQPIAPTALRSVSSPAADDRTEAEAQAVAETNVVEDEAPPPAPAPAMPNEDAAPEPDAPKIDAAPSNEGAAPVEAPLTLETWDDVLATYDNTAALAPAPVELPADESRGDVPAGSSALAAGAAVAAWGVWEVRSRRNDRRARPWPPTTSVR